MYCQLRLLRPDAAVPDKDVSRPLVRRLGVREIDAHRSDDNGVVPNGNAAAETVVNRSVVGQQPSLARPGVAVSHKHIRRAVERFSVDLLEICADHRRVAETLMLWPKVL